MNDVWLVLQFVIDGVPTVVQGWEPLMFDSYDECKEAFDKAYVYISEQLPAGQNAILSCFAPVESEVVKGGSLN